MTCAFEFLAEPIEHELAFTHAWNFLAMERYRARGEQHAGKDASERKSLSMPNSNSVGSQRARRGSE
jgi:hypothetical protein